LEQRRLGEVVEDEVLEEMEEEEPLEMLELDPEEMEDAGEDGDLVGEEAAGDELLRSRHELSEPDLDGNLG